MIRPYSPTPYSITSRSGRKLSKLLPLKRNLRYSLGPTPLHDHKSLQELFYLKHVFFVCLFSFCFVFCWCFFFFFFLLVFCFVLVFLFFCLFFFFFFSVCDQHFSQLRDREGREKKPKRDKKRSRKAKSITNFAWHFNHEFCMALIGRLGISRCLCNPISLLETENIISKHYDHNRERDKFAYLTMQLFCALCTCVFH